MEDLANIGVPVHRHPVTRQPVLIAGASFLSETHMSEEAQDKVKKISADVVKALNNLSGEDPEPRYLLVEERHLRGLAESLELAAGAKRLEVIKESVLDEKRYVEELIKESYSMTFEEGEVLVERLSDNENVGAESHRGATQTHRAKDKMNPTG